MDEEEEGQEEVEVNDMRASLVLGQRRQLRISRDFDLAKRPDQGSAAFVFCD